MPKVTNTQLSFAVVFGGVIAFLLLALYAMIVGSLIWEVFQVGRAGQGQADNFAQGAIHGRNDNRRLDLCVGGVQAGGDEARRCADG